MSKNSNLHKAKGVKNDEFYTRLEDIEKELSNYKQHFENKIVYCNCDSVPESQFWVYFHTHFAELRLKKLVATHFDRHNFTDKYEYSGGDDADISAYVATPLNSHGDFRSPQCTCIMRESDIVITNPPWSLFLQYMIYLNKYARNWLILGTQNAISYKEIFSYIQANKLWLGCNSGDMAFRVPADAEERETRFWIDEDNQKWRSLGNCCWFTNLEHANRHKPLELVCTYSADKYPTYINHDAVNCDRYVDIPCDYDGIIGVPITYLQYHCPEQFDIVGFRKGTDNKDLYYKDGDKVVQPYFRILIQKKSSDCS